MKKIIIGVVSLLALAGIGGAAVIYKKKNNSSEETQLHLVEETETE